ncbi:N-acylneuraminate cytidylyltransferase [Sulfurivirga caldicuralii]|uniref:N-acylneuraminate cytidylyltransferase n=1 Tax=Sulfurivirga caldicuralii TaxID=364032 RepID=A0A1N6E6I6_9GAMM|nr:acylneuraminate cytidylyltransferase family protein [Sulfurivirga caldicuralii]SIN78624.1 N-acylneuraminate cytidylyltransferase [Sulfurivirga caldicuralii]
MSYQGKTFLGVIPARGGSKRLPEKNIRPLAGKPLLGWTAEAALQSKYLDDVLVSTDSEAIAQVARDFGVAVPFMRPTHLATDEASTFSVLRHALSQWEALHGPVDYVVVLQPTSPLRTAQHIDEAIELAVEKAAGGVASVCPVDHPPEWMNTLSEDGRMDNFLRPQVIGKRSQEFPQQYRLNGAVGISRAENIREGRDFWHTPRLYAYRMDPLHSVDIDSELDFLLAETILRQRGHS